MLINWKGYLDQAEKAFVFDESDEFLFDLRRPAGDLDYYEKFEREVLLQNLFQVSQFRWVREGRVKISRPSQIRLSKESLLKERAHLEGVHEDFQRLIRSSAEFGLRDFLKSNYWELKYQTETVESCVQVLRYLESHLEEIRGLSFKQIPHGASTKLIGKENILLRIFSSWKKVTATWSDFYAHYKIAPRAIEFRFFASKCRWRQGAVLEDFQGVISSQLVKNYSFENLDRTLFVENYDAFMGLSSKPSSCLLVWSGGWRAVALRRIFQFLPRPFFYWGDIDKEGFEIFGHLLELDPHIRPIMMDEGTIEKFPHLIQKKPPFEGPFRALGPYQKIYESVCREGLFIEQEQLLQGFEPHLLAKGNN